MAFGPAVRVAIKVAPVALEVARQLDRQLRPHVLAYRSARDVDGYVGRWTAQDAAHWLVFPDREGQPLHAFPPLAADELATAGRQLDRASLRHHTELPESRARQAVNSVRSGPARLRRSRRGGAAGDDELGVTVVETTSDQPRRDDTRGHRPRSDQPRGGQSRGGQPRSGPPLPPPTSPPPHPPPA